GSQIRGRHGAVAKGQYRFETGRSEQETMRTVWVAVLAAGLAGGSTFAETNEQRGKRVVNEALAALGGEHYLAMRDRLEAGRAYSFYNENLTGLALAKIYTR